MTPPNDRPRGLGRGLSALIGDEVAAVKGEPAAAKKDARTLPVAFLRPGKYQPRKQFDEQPLADLAASVKEKGVLSPILVRPIGPDAYEKMTYYERWITSITSTLLQRGAISSDELAKKLADVERREKAGVL